MANLSREAADRFPVKTESTVDHKAWAKRIVWREQNGDDTMTMAQVAFAREALELPKS